VVEIGACAATIHPRLAYPCCDQDATHVSLGDIPDNVHRSIASYNGALNPARVILTNVMPAIGNVGPVVSTGVGDGVAVVYGADSSSDAYAGMNSNMNHIPKVIHKVIADMVNRFIYMSFDMIKMCIVIVYVYKNYI